MMTNTLIGAIESGKEYEHSFEIEVYGKQVELTVRPLSRKERRKVSTIVNNGNVLDEKGNPKDVNKYAQNVEKANIYIAQTALVGEELTDETCEYLPDHVLEEIVNQVQKITSDKSNPQTIQEEIAFLEKEIEKRKEQLEDSNAMRRFRTGE